MRNILRNLILTIAILAVGLMVFTGCQSQTEETNGEKVTFYGDLNPLFNYYQIDIFGLKIEDTKNVSVVLGNLIGTSTTLTYKNNTWQIIFMQMTNPQAIEYSDLRRVSYNMTLKCIVNKI